MGKNSFFRVISYLEKFKIFNPVSSFIKKYDEFFTEFYWIILVCIYFTFYRLITSVLYVSFLLVRDDDHWEFIQFIYWGFIKMAIGVAKVSPVVGDFFYISFVKIYAHERWQNPSGVWVAIAKRNQFWVINWSFTFLNEFIIPRIFQEILPAFFDDIKTRWYNFVRYLTSDYVNAQTKSEKFVAALKIFGFIIFNIFFAIIILTNHFWGNDILNLLVYSKDLLFSFFYKLWEIILNLFK